MPREEFCQFAPPGSVECDRKVCSNCGWNPLVAIKRLEAIKQKLTEEVAKNGKSNTVG